MYNGSVISSALLVGLVLLPSALRADTAAPLAQERGPDDFNYTTLFPYTSTNSALYVTTCPWLAPSLPNSASKNNVGWDFSDPAKWRFRFAQDVPGLTPIAAGTITTDVYSAWASDNDAFNNPAGDPAQLRDVMDQDAGGADFTLVYKPGATDPGGDGKTTLDNVHFFQFVRAITTFGDAKENPKSTQTQYFIDNGGDLTSPFYDELGISGTIGTTKKWMQDIPYRCENDDGNADCTGGTDGYLLSIDWEAQVFMAVNMGANKDLGTQNDVILYGGRWWGFQFSSVDTPEPAFGILSGFALLGLAALKRYRIKAATLRPGAREPSPHILTTQKS